MRWILTLALVALVIPLFVVDTAAECGRGCKCPTCAARDKAVTNFIYDVTIPWPFRHHAGDLDGDGVDDSMDKCPNTPMGATVDPAGCPKDSDGDGVYDGLDKCPDTPRGARVDATGCTGDSDGDGVADGLDQCPGTPAGARVDSRGCPSDEDGDGVVDGIDKCPRTPRGAKVDAAGCPMDSDGDGVYDGLDKCPDTPKGARVWDDGCPMTEVQQQFIDTGVFSTTEIVFDTGKATIKPQSEEVLGKIGAFLVAHPEIEVEVGGHTDSQGAEDKNQTLSEQRAEAVMSYLLEKNPDIERSQLTSKGYGESNPVASNDTAEGRAQNRRVEFKLLKK
jgi:OOP family OmpA-OmpF porin